VHGLSDGHVFELSPHRDGIVGRRIQNSHDRKSLWMLVRHGPTKALMRYDRATDTTTKVRDLLEYRDRSDLEILPSGANALMTRRGRWPLQDSR
jgi:hypothetical protein